MYNLPNLLTISRIVVIPAIFLSIYITAAWWAIVAAILFIIADRSLFLANADPASRISVMTLIKQSGCLVTILGGKFFFDEKNIGYKLICASVIVAGIVIAVL